MQKKISFRSVITGLLSLVVIFAAIYGCGRLYYRLTGGFTIGNIVSDLSYDPRWKLRELSHEEKEKINHILDQEFNYLGKGCQAYVFLSQDGDYVLKFFKYQRFRHQRWLDYLTFIPTMDCYLQQKRKRKQEKLENVFKSWKIAFEDLREETGVVYAHLNKTDDLNKILVIRDKLGLVHHLDLDKIEFLLQKRANMLCPTLKEMMEKDDITSAKNVIDQLIAMLIFEYQRGFADNDHALMQNTGVLAGAPIHVDVGQLIHNDIVKDPSVYRTELFNKTYKFRKWLEGRFPELSTHLDKKLQEIIGEQFFHMKPYSHQGDVAKIPNNS
jgi:hypothetical protein